MKWFTISHHLIHHHLINHLMIYHLIIHIEDIRKIWNLITISSHLFLFNISCNLVNLEMRRRSSNERNEMVVDCETDNNFIFYHKMVDNILFYHLIYHLLISHIIFIVSQSSLWKNNWKNYFWPSTISKIHLSTPSLISVFMVDEMRW